MYINGKVFLQRLLDLGNKLGQITEPLQGTFLTSVTFC